MLHLREHKKSTNYRDDTTMRTRQHETTEMLEQLKLPIQYSPDTSAKTCAAAILNEESTNLCCVCNREIDNDRNRCSLYILVCHDDCMCVGAIEDDMCLTCAANQSQRRMSQENEWSEVQLSPHENGRYGETPWIFRFRSSVKYWSTQQPP